MILTRFFILCPLNFTRHESHVIMSITNVECLVSYLKPSNKKCALRSHLNSMTRNPNREPESSE